MIKIPSVSIIIPVYNEENTIAQVISSVLRQQYTLFGFNLLEIIVVNDASTDHTGMIVNKICKKTALVVQVSHKKNRGKGAAVRTGLDCAKGTFILIQDADLEYNPDDYPLLFKPLAVGRTEVVFGTRMRTKTPPKFYVSLLGNKLLTSVTNVLFRSQLSDVFVGYKVFKRELIKDAHFNCNGFDIEIELTTYFLRQNYQIAEVPISYHGRSWEEGKKISVIDGIISLYKIFKFRLNF